MRNKFYEHQTEQDYNSTISNIDVIQKRVNYFNNAEKIGFKLFLS